MFAVSLNHLVGYGEQRLRDGAAEGFGGLEVYDKLELGRRLARQVGWFFALADGVDVAGCELELVEDIRTIGDQPTGDYKVAKRVDRGQFVPCRQRRDHVRMVCPERTCCHN